MKKIKFTLLLTLLTAGLVSCEMPTTDAEKQKEVGDNLAENQPTPTDIDYSLERYNLIRRAYWVNGQKEKARTVERPTEVPLGYCVLFTESGNVIGQFTVDGKVSSLNSFLTPDSNYYETYKKFNEWIPDVDGSYGENDNGIFFFTSQWQYIEWTGTYIYSDSPFKISETVLGEY